jgi:hypothetical protein
VRFAGAAILIGLLCSTSHQAVRAQPAAYRFYQINAGFSPAMDVNDHGTVVGWWFGPSVSVNPNTNSMGYVWTFVTGAQPIITDPATVRKFPKYTAVNDPSAPLRISGTGTIAGTECPSGCGVSGTHAAIWNSSQGLVDLGSFDNNAQNSFAAGINNSNQVVGFSGGGGYNNSGPFIWSAGSGLQKLSGFTGLNGYAVGINSHGEVVGSKGTGSRSVPFVWSPALGEIDIPDVQSGAATSVGFAINDSAVVIGRYLAPDNTTYRVFRWSGGAGIEDLNAPAGFPELMDINNAGDIVVTIIQQGRRVPYLYQSGSWTNLNQLMPSGTGFTLQFVQAINNKGWIVGAGTTDPNGAELSQGFVIVPPSQAPVASNGTASVMAGSSVSGTLIATDPEGDSLSFSIVTNGTKGTAAIDRVTGAYTYTANVGSSGTDTFTFKANDGFGDSNTATITVTITSGAPLQAPLNLRASSVVGNLVTFRWDLSPIGPRPTSFVVEGGIAPGQVLASLDTTSPFPVFTVSAPTGAFHVRVHAVTATERSGPSNEIQIFVNTPTPPSPPANLLALVNGSSLALTWRPRFFGGAATAHVLNVAGSMTASLPLSEATSVAFGAVPGGTYTLSVSASNTSGTSAASNAVTVTVPGPCSGAPLAPAGFLAYRVGNTIYVVWDPPASGPAPTQYVLTVSGAFNLSVPTTARALSGAVGPGSYGLSVAASNACGSSAATAVQTVTVP